MYAIVIIFDEEMMTTGTSSVTNPQNYRLLHDDVAVLGGIREVHFGLNKASELSPIYGLSASKTNKFEAVLLLDANGNAPGVSPLVEGRYEIEALNSLRDVTGNPLGSTGLNPNGNSASQVIDVTVPSAGEIRIAGEPAGGQFTHPHSPQAVAEDADGDYVVVRKQRTARDGQIAIVQTDEGEATLKRFYLEKNRIRLEPANPDMKPIYVKHAKILGVVVGVVRKVA
ncbi:hypothetical protein LCGC14_2795590 [marine sediment metagenome]|uniref:Peptidase S24/S26A/S26B/S26C domain-containing protein n=1 Tax=marine sediment metagenome TaxID=412755 RepID=A0A0F8YP56_9ZZZZ